MASITETTHAGEFLVQDISAEFNREVVTILSGQNLAAGAVLGKVALGAATAAHVAGGTGNSSFSGAGGVGNVVVHKVAQAKEVFTDTMLASRNENKCRAIAADVK